MRLKALLTVSAVLVLGCGIASAQEESSPAPAKSSLSYLISDEPLFPDTEIGWKGFLTGMRASYTMQENFVDPVGNPIYFESPFVETNLDIVYLWHDFPKDSQLAGGEAHVLAAQLRVALTDRLAFIATKSGYSWIESGITPDADGWNDLAVGLKYILWVDDNFEGCQCIGTAGIRWEWTQGDDTTLMGGDSGSQELSPFFSFAKGWDDVHLLGNITYRAPMDHNDGNHIVSWDLHLDWECCPETLPGFVPLVEVHGMHYFSNGEALPLRVGGLDYSNIGSSDVNGKFTMWGDLGFRWELTPNVSVGCAYGFPLTSPGNDIFNQRLTARLTLSY